MEHVTCPYCGAEVDVLEVEKEAGACPECGAMIHGSALPGDEVEDFDEDEEGEEFDAAYEDDEEDLDDDDDEYDV